ncbi:replicative DNA helicase [Betaproteobacteria bacterium]|nr:replicative DNA helicase [Betaproteobacteria bacterium]
MSYDDYGLTLPPQSIEAEQSVLGALLLDNASYERLDGLLVRDDFYRADHRKIFSAITAMLDHGQPADVVTVADSLDLAGEGNETGGLAYLGELAVNTPTATNIRRYAEIVRDCRIRRDIMATGQRISELSAAGDAAGLLEKATDLVMALVDARHAGREPQTIGELLPGVLDAIDDRAKRGGEVSGLSTGFVDLDRLTCGLQAGDLIIVAGRPSMGKTTLAINVAENVAVAGGAVFVASLEMSAKQLVERSVARFCGIDTQALRSGQLSQSDYDGLSASLARLREQRLIIADDPMLSSVGRIRMASRKTRQRLGALDLIVIDYLQLMRGEGNTRNEELSAITRSLKLLAREMSCPVILLSQLSRAVESRTDKRPMLSDMRESGAIEQDADVVLMCYRDDYYRTDGPLKGYAEILVRKQRMGPTGDVPLVFQGWYSRFLPANLRDFAEARARSSINAHTTRGFDE